jgi:hypothetical protein
LYDLIGDIHGYANPLEKLLVKLGYSKKQGYYSHPSRRVIYLGDFIDRGPDQRSVLDIVMPMVRNGSALAVMGNHEFNALAFHTPNISKPGTWLRPRYDKNVKQHMAFLSAYLETDELQEVLSFFRSLPLWLELPGLRVVHACWDQNCIETLTPSVAENNTITDQLLFDASSENSVFYATLETLLKGREIDLPEGSCFRDKDGIERRQARVRWWLNEDSTLSDAVLPLGIVAGDAATQIISKVDLGGYDPRLDPVFFGHYWFQGSPSITSPNAMCLDYSIARGGKLAAYRWEWGAKSGQPEHRLGNRLAT